MRNLPLHIKILIGLLTGIVWALLSSSLGWNQFTIQWIDPFGVIFIRLLKFIAVPLVLFSIISGVSGLSDTTALGRLGAKTLLAYLVTTVAAVAIGLVLVNFIKPGNMLDDSQRLKNRISYEMWLMESDLGQPKDGKNYMNMKAHQHLLTSEWLKSTTDDDLNKIDEKKKLAKQKQSDGPLQFFIDMVPENIVGSISDNTLMLQVIFFAIFFGVTIVFVPNHAAKPVIDFINSMNEIFLKMVNIVMQAAPYFVFALLAGVIAKMADTPGEVIAIFIGLGSYSLTVIFGLIIMVFVFYPLLLRVFVRKLPLREFLTNISPAQFLGFSTSSSAATLPVTMECVEENMGVPKKISSFVLPVGATVNMDGTSLYQAVAVVFLAQLHMVDLNFSQQLMIVLTATLASIGAAATPSASLVMMIVVLQSVGLNPAWIAIIFPVDRILDMCRTVVNITGDAAVCTLIAKSEGELKKY